MRGSASWVAGSAGRAVSIKGTQVAVGATAEGSLASPAPVGVEPDPRLRVTREALLGIGLLLVALGAAFGVREATATTHPHRTGVSIPTTPPIVQPSPGIVTVGQVSAPGPLKLAPKHVAPVHHSAQTPVAPVHRSTPSTSTTQRSSQSSAPVTSTPHTTSSPPPTTTTHSTGSTSHSGGSGTGTSSGSNTSSGGTGTTSGSTGGSSGSSGGSSGSTGSSSGKSGGSSGVSSGG